MHSALLLTSRRWIILRKSRNIPLGLVIEAGGIVVTVDEGRLDMHIKKGA